jgi:hypothetical protein
MPPRGVSRPPELKSRILIDTEIDEPDDGSFLPGKDANWAATKFDP